MPISVYFSLAEAGRIWYTALAADSFAVEGGEHLMDTLITFMLSVVASVIAYYICKWMDEK